MSARASGLFINMDLCLFIWCEVPPCNGPIGPPPNKRSSVLPDRRNTSFSKVGQLNDKEDKVLHKSTIRLTTSAKKCVRTYFSNRLYQPRLLSCFSASRSPTAYCRRSLSARYVFPTFMGTVDINRTG